MLATEFIQQKRLGQEHAAADLTHFITGYVNGTIPDYQVSAWLMAVCLKGMTPHESATFTEVMLNSGQKITWPSGHLRPTDKHSTGGIGDKTSLVIAPLVAAFGVTVPMMAGRGLGFTGGTLDKLESIPGFQTRLSLSQFKEQMRSLGVAIIGQTDEICPADRKMYALRDVTGTVDSIPLICASILSKKIAEGAKALVMDVKYGSGAFMETLEQAQALAHALIQIGRLGGVNTSALITDMNQPLGRYVGNALEVHECLEILNGRGFDEKNFELYKNGQPLKPGIKDFSETAFLSLELSAHMLVQSGYSTDLESCRKQCLEKLKNGSALKKFQQLTELQCGRLEDFEIGSKEQKTINASHDGYLNFISNKDLGLALLLLGGGRKTHADPIDYAVGIEVLARHGDPVVKGQPLFHVHFNSNTNLNAATNHIQRAFEITSTTPQFFPLIKEVLS